MTLRRGETGAVVAFSAAAALLGLVSNRLLTEAVAPADLGRLYLFSNLAVWLTLPALASATYVARHWPLAVASGQAALLLRGLRGGVVGSLLLSALGAAALGALGLVPLGASSWPLLAVAAAGGAAGLLLEPIPAAARRRGLAGLLSLAAAPGRQALLAATGWALGATWLGAAHAAHALAYGLLAGLAVWRLRRGEPATSPPPTTAPEVRLSLAGYLRFTGPTLATTALAVVVASAERWGLAAHADLAATALFAQALGLATAAVGAGAGFLSTLFVPVVAEAAGASTRPVAAASRPLGRYLRSVGLGVAALTLAGWWLAEPAAVLLLGPRYQAVGRLLPITLAGAGLLALGQALQIVPWLARETAWPAAARLASNGAYLALLLVPWRSADLALTFSWCYLAAQAGFAALMALAALRQAAFDRAAARAAEVAP